MLFRRVSWLIGFSWLFAIIFSSPMVIFRGTIEIPGTQIEQCYHLTEKFGKRPIMMYVMHELPLYFISPAIGIFT